MEEKIKINTNKNHDRFPPVIRYHFNRDEFAKVLADERLAPGAKLILWRLVEYLGGKSYSWPSQVTLGLELGMKDRTIRHHLKRLKALGYITWKKGGVNPKTGRRFSSNQYSLYKLVFPREEKMEVEKNE